MFAKITKADLINCVLILCCAVLAGKGLFANVLVYGHDTMYHFVKAVAVHQSWCEGNFLARWTPHLVDGYGYPLLHFYSPLFYYFSSAFMFIFSPVIAFNMTFFFFLFLSGFAMYLFAREVWGGRGALVATVAYLFAPYHLLNIYVRMTATEATAFVTFPLALWAVLRIMRHVTFMRFLAVGLSVAALLLSHNIAALMLMPVVGAYVLFLFLVDEKRKAFRLWAGLSALLAGILLAAYFIIPAMMEKVFVNISRLTSGYMDYHQHFAYFDQLIYSPWGFGISLAGHGDHMSFMLGILHLLLAVAVIMFWKKIAVTMKGAAAQIIFFSLVLIGTLFMTMEASSFLWRSIPLLPFVQYPWRFLLGATMAVSFLAGGVVCLVEERFQKYVMVAICCLIIAINIGYCRASQYSNENTGSSFVAFLRASTPLDSMEYLPIWVQKVSRKAPAEKLQVWAGDALIADEGGKPLNRKFSVQAKTLSALCFHSYYFPGWEVFVNGEPTEINPENPFGLIVFTVPPGDHSVNIHFGTTPLRRAAEGVSLIMLVILFTGFIFRKRLDEWIAQRLEQV
ncbi:MAG: 6-pyruvoyl-tetrahydropterin synthase-related protein [Deltaproteobacteria bacterium]|nr:6-pyruvoyl-tetrahydropterin synthase-related protein [Deltaproteobacteria bacterium]